MHDSCSIDIGHVHYGDFRDTVMRAAVINRTYNHLLHPFNSAVRLMAYVGFLTEDTKCLKKKVQRAPSI